MALRRYDMEGAVGAGPDQWEVNFPPKLDRVDVVRKRGHLSLLQGGVTLAEGDQAFDHWARNDEGQSGLPEETSGLYYVAFAAQKEARQQAEEGVEPPSPFPLI